MGSSLLNSLKQSVEIHMTTRNVLVGLPEFHGLARSSLMTLHWRTLDSGNIVWSFLCRGKKLRRNANENIMYCFSYLSTVFV